MEDPGVSPMMNFQIGRRVAVLAPPASRSDRGLALLSPLGGSQIVSVALVSGIVIVACRCCRWGIGIAIEPTCVTGGNIKGTGIDRQRAGDEAERQVVIGDQGTLETVDGVSAHAAGRRGGGCERRRTGDAVASGR